MHVIQALQILILTVSLFLKEADNQKEKAILYK